MLRNRIRIQFWRQSAIFRPTSTVQQSDPGHTQNVQPQNEEQAELKRGMDTGGPAKSAGSSNIRSLLRMSHASESAAVSFFEGQAWGMKGRIDSQYFLQQEQEHLETVSELGSRSRSRPSALLPLLKSGGWALGVVSACAPSKISRAIVGAVQDALSEQYNDHIRELRSTGEIEQMNELRLALLKLRDSSRAPEGSPRPPDFAMAGNLKNMSLEEAVGTAVKASCKTLAGVSRKI